VINASYIHDLNQPEIRKTTGKTYDLVIDAGTMKDVFDVRQVFENLTDLTKIN
jgi:hypothetical protein